MHPAIETSRATGPICVPVRWSRHVVLRTTYINPRRMQIQWRESLGCIRFRRGLLSLASLLRHILVSQSEVRRTRPGCESVYKLSNGVEPTGRSHPAATKSLIARNRSHTRKRARRRAICASALAAEPRPH